MAKTVSIISAKSEAIINGLPKETKKRVCAYCRVSTDTEEQLSSYKAQITYYEDYIKRRPDWEYAGVYADEGVTGTNTKHRIEFKRMIEEANEGNFDMIITKSISRFARNTFDCLKYVRLLKEKGVAVYFEKENIDTMDSKGEVLLTILSSLAQDESRSISENSRWGIVRRFQQGKIRVSTTNFMGYDKDENGNLIINEEQAKIVRRIFKEYLGGYGPAKIVKGLMADGIPTVMGKKKWYISTISTMLRNEKYCGDVLLQKSVTVDFLTHKRVKNRGQAQQFYVENNHEPIVSKEMFEQTQVEIKRRADIFFKGDDNLRKRHSNKYPFSGKIICGNCNAIFTRARWGLDEKSKKYVWICKTKRAQGVDVCDMKTVKERELEAAFVRVANRIIEDKTVFIKKMMANIERVLIDEKNTKQLKKVDTRLEELRRQISNLVKLNSKSNMDIDIYEEEHTRIALEIEELREKRNELIRVDLERKKERSNLVEIEKLLKERDLISKFDERLFFHLVDHIKVVSIVEVEFVLKTGIVEKEIL